MKPIKNGVTKNKIYNRFWHLGNVYPSCSSHWNNIVWIALTEIERRNYPSWMPVILMKILATKIPFRYKYWYKPVNIFIIKEKYAQLRIYDCEEDIYNWAVIMSATTCEECGNTTSKLELINGWYRILCKKCLTKYKNE